MYAESYAAGLLDGEGCITASRPKPGKRNHQLLVVFCMCGREPLEFLADHFGGNVTEGRKTRTGRQTYNWSLGGGTAIGFLSRVEPFVIAKKEQLELALTYPPFEGWGSGHRSGPVPEEIRAERDRIALRLKELKRA